MELSQQPPEGHVNHVRESALVSARNIGIEIGAKILEKGLKQWPDELETGIKWVVMERRKKLK